MRLSLIPFQPTDAQRLTRDTRGCRSPFTLRRSLFVLLALLAGCTSPKATEPEPVPPPPRAPEVVAAEQVFESGQVREATIACVDIARKNPQAAGLADLQQRIAQKLADDRLAAAEKRSEPTNRKQTADAKMFSVTPDSYRAQQHVIGENAPLRTAPSAMQKALAKPVTVHLVNAGISAIIAQIGQSENINIVADSEISEKTLTIHAVDTPLIEVLDFIGRNLNVTFSVGSNLIWVTPREEVSTGVPMETRVYRLRKGLIGSELGKSAGSDSAFKSTEDSDRRSSSDQADKKSEAKDGKIGLLDAIARFVPQPEGSDVLFNDKVHALIVKNTRENLSTVEDLIEALDIRPLQVLIEARFVTTTVSDMRKLGIDWLIDNRGGSRFATPGAESTMGDITYPDPGKNTLVSATQFKNDAFTGKIIPVAADGTGGGTFAYQFLLGDTALQATLHALEATGDSRTVAVPRITTINNHEARFRQGKDFRYYDEWDFNDVNYYTGTSGNNNGTPPDTKLAPSGEPQVQELGYSLVVTPSVGADLSTINLRLQPEIVDDNVEWLSPPASGDSGSQSLIYPPLPLFNKSTITTEAIVRSGETVVLGGLVNTSKSKSVSGVPWLSSLPLIGRLFGTEVIDDKNENLIIFVTATLISDVGEELIPLNELERYGAPVPKGAEVPNVLKEAAVNATPAPAPAAAPAPAPEAPKPAAPAAAVPAPAPAP